jgi:hypothetical protein
MEAFFQKAEELAAEDIRFALTFPEQLEDYAVTNIKPGVLANLIGQTQGFTSKGIQIPDGETQLGQALEDGFDHTEFYMDLSSLEDIMLDLYPLERQANNEG